MILLFLKKKKVFVVFVAIHKAISSRPRQVVGLIFTLMKQSHAQLYSF
jgi:hypothetical protein